MIKQRPCIAIFIGESVRASGEIYEAQLASCTDLVRSVYVDADEPNTNVRQKIDVALTLYTAENLERLAHAGLLVDTSLQDVPVLVVLHQDDISALRQLASTIIEAADSYPNLSAKLRFTTLVLSEAELHVAREAGALALKAIEDLATTDGVAFRNTAILICKEYRGAPASETTLAPILSRISSLLTTFEYDRRSSAFSQFWNTHLGGGGHVYFGGLVAYKIENSKSCAKELLYKAAGANLVQLLQANGANILENLKLDELIRRSLSEISTGSELTYGSKEWNELAERYRKHVAQRLLTDLLPQTKSLSDLCLVLETIREKVAPAKDTHDDATPPTIATALLVFSLTVPQWITIGIVTILSIIAFAALLRRRPQPAAPVPIPVSEIPRNPILASVLTELLGLLCPSPAAFERAHSAKGFSSVEETENHQGGSIRADKLPLCEVVYSCDKSGALAVAAQEAVSAAFGDAFNLLLLTRLRDGRWLTSEKAAELGDLHNKAVQQIFEAIMADFLDDALNTENERGRSLPVQDALFAPKLQTTDSQRFTFVGPGLFRSQDTYERYAVRDTINFLYLVE